MPELKTRHYKHAVAVRYVKNPRHPRGLGVCRVIAWKLKGEDRFRSVENLPSALRAALPTTIYIGLSAGRSR